MVQNSRVFKPNVGDSFKMYFPKFVKSQISWKFILQRKCYFLTLFRQHLLLVKCTLPLSLFEKWMITKDNSIIFPCEYSHVCTSHKVSSTCREERSAGVFRVFEWTGYVQSVSVWFWASSMHIYTQNTTACLSELFMMPSLNIHTWKPSAISNPQSSPVNNIPAKSKQKQRSTLLYFLFFFVVWNFAISVYTSPHPVFLFLL